MTPAVLEPAICPECRAGKHDNCDGTALDVVNDEIVECECSPCLLKR